MVAEGTLVSTCPAADGDAQSAPSSEIRHHAPRATENSVRATKAEILNDASEEVRNILRYELNAAISHFIQRDQPVYLEGFGILFPEIHTEQKSEISDDCTYYVWSETFRTVIFEKCYELITMHRERFSEIAETRELARWIYPRLPLYLSAKWAERDIRRLLRAVIDTVRHQVVDLGHSAELNSVGDFFALHNRQGRIHAEWYAGADIFLHASWHQVISTSRKKVFERPELKSAWELFEAAYGPPVGTFEVFLPKELRAMGYDPSLLPSDQEQNIRVAAFKNTLSTSHSGHGGSSGSSGNAVYIFCTDGLRTLGLQAKKSKGYGNEVVFQVTEKGADSFIHRREDAPIELARRPITAAWMLMQSAHSRTLRPGAGLNVEAPLYGEPFSAHQGSGRGSGNSASQRANVSTIFATPLTLVRGPQISVEGIFHYINVIGVCDDEAALAARYSPEYLLSMLEHRKLTQVSSLLRPSMLLRTELTHNLGRRPPGATSTFMTELPAGDDPLEEHLVASSS